MGSEGLSLGAQPRRGAELRSHLEEVRLGQGSGRSRVAEQPCEGKLRPQDGRGPRASGESLASGRWERKEGKGRRV